MQDNKGAGWRDWTKHPQDPQGKSIGQKQLAEMVQLQGVSLTRESLVKIERGIQHISLDQLRSIKDCLGTSYNDLLD